MQSEIYGIIGALSGTILGWILSELSKKGKLNIFISWEDKFEYNEKGSMVVSDRKDNSNLFSYHASIDIYNSSDSPMIMRKITIEFLRDKNFLFCDVPKDDLTKRLIGSIYLYDDISAITIPAKAVCSIKLHGSFWDSDERFAKIWDTNKVVLSYRDNRNKQRKQIINNKNYNEYYEI